MWAAAAAGTGVAPSQFVQDQRDRSRTQGFYPRYQELCQKGEVLGSNEYKYLSEKLDEYAEFQQKYAVKQSEIERTKRVANYCGLDFPEPHRREGTEHVKPTPKDPNAPPKKRKVPTAAKKEEKEEESS